MTPHQFDESATMSFGDHLEELRRRILWAAGPALPLAIVLFFFSDYIIRLLVAPLRNVLERQALPPRILALAPPEVLLVKLKLSFILAAVILAPWILWQAWLFIRPGLYEQERRFVRFLIPGSAVLTAAGVALLYYGMLPLTLQVLVTVGSGLDLGQSEADLHPVVVSALETSTTVELRSAPPADPPAGAIWFLVPDQLLYVGVPDENGVVTPTVVHRRPKAQVAQEYRLHTYISFVLLLLLGIVIAFQMPLVILLLGWVGLATPEWLRSKRRYALLVCGVLGALLTPADVISMLALMFPLYALYELGIVLLVIAPASRVAEGRVGLPVKTGGTDKGPGASSQPTEPVQSEDAIPRSTERKDDPDETS